jgi:hypothetical protein
MQIKSVLLMLTLSYSVIVGAKELYDDRYYIENYRYHPLQRHNDPNLPLAKLL